MRVARWGVAVAAAGSLLASACTVGECDFDPCPPGRGQVRALDDQGGERWRTEVADRSGTAPLVTGDHVVVTGCRAVHVLDAGTGRLVLRTERIEDAIGVAGGMVWGRDAGTGRGVRGVPLDGGSGERSIVHEGGTDGRAGDFARTLTISGDLLVGSHDDELSVQPAAGEPDPDRSVQLPVRPTQRIVIVDGVVVAASEDGSVVGVDLESMRLLWRVVPSVVARRYTLRVEGHGRTVLVSAVTDSVTASATGVRATELLAVSAHAGRVLWRRTGWQLAGADATRTVAVSPTAVAVVGTTTGREIWSRRLAGGYSTGYADVQLSSEGQGAVVTDDVVTLQGHRLDGGGVLLAADARTGRERWRVVEGTRPAAAGDTVVAAEPEAGLGNLVWLVAREASTGEERWRLRPLASAPTAPDPTGQVAADPRRGQTVVAVLPPVPQGGCF